MKKMTKLDTLKTMVAKWYRSRSIVDAYEVCEFLAKNLNLEDTNEATK